LTKISVFNRQEEGENPRERRCAQSRLDAAEGEGGIHSLGGTKLGREVAGKTILAGGERLGRARTIKSFEGRSLENVAGRKNPYRASQSEEKRKSGKKGSARASGGSWAWIEIR